MGFWGSLGKGLLKAGKMASPLIGMVPGGGFINAGIGAVDKAVNKGGIGPSKMPGGIGGGIPGNNFLRNDVNSVSNRMGPQQQFGRELGQMFGSGQGPR